MNESLISIDKPGNFLLVEGSDDYHVCYHLLTSHKIKISEEVEFIDEQGQIKTRKQGQVKIINKQGIKNLLQTLEVELLRSDLEHLGILVDADENLTSRWQSLCNILFSSGYSTIPEIPNPDGTIIKENDKPAVGIWIMPDNQLPGMLEHFCSFLVPANDILWTTAETSLQQVILQDRRFIEQHTIKAHLHTWLAWQEEPGKPIGQAITKRFLDPKAPHAQQFIQWIRLLFEIET